MSEYQLTGDVAFKSRNDVVRVVASFSVACLLFQYTSENLRKGSECKNLNILLNFETSNRNISENTTTSIRNNSITYSTDTISTYGTNVVDVVRDLSGFAFSLKKAIDNRDEDWYSDALSDPLPPPVLPAPESPSNVACPAPPNMKSMSPAYIEHVASDTETAPPHVEQNQSPSDKSFFEGFLSWMSEPLHRKNESDWR